MKSLRLIVPLLLLLGASLVHAAEFSAPEQKIAGADKPIPLGELVELAVPPVKEKPQYYMGASYDWKVVDLSTGKDRKYRAYDSGVCFSAGIQSKRLLALCAVTHLFVVKQGNAITEVGTKTVLLSAEVDIGDGSAPDPAPPGPAPGPAPVLPEARFKLSSTINNFSRTSVTNIDSRIRGAKVLATSFRGIASSIAAGALTEPEDILKKTATSNISALNSAGVARSDWEGVFRQLMEVVYQLYDTSKIQSATDFKDAWTEIAIGLEAVK